VLDERHPTLAEMLAGRGWTTAGFVSSFVLDRRWGIARGFDHYFDDFDLKEFDTASLGSVQRDGADTVAAAVDWLDTRPQDQPFFMWLHLYDPHEPYEPAEPFKSRYPGRPYDAEVAYTDSLIGRFRGALEDRGLLEDSLVILTTDHGEGLGDHGEMFHGYYIYDSTIHVAMIVRPPSSPQAGLVADHAVSHVDLVPTILDLIGARTPDVVHGRSLAPILAGETVARDRPVYAESLYPLLHYGWAPLRSLRTDRFKLIDVPRPELYDLVEDPVEESNVHRDQPNRAGELTAELAELRQRIETDDPPGDAAPEMDEETLAQLQALGYMAGQGGVSIEDEDDVVRADPKDRLQLHQKMMAAQSRMGSENTETARRLLEQVLAEDEAIFDAHQMLGSIAGIDDRPEDAARHFRRALELQPDNERCLFGLSAAYADLEQFEEALIGFHRIIEISGSAIRASIAIADIHIGLGDFDQAAAVLEEASTGDEASAFIANKLGEVRVEQGRDAEAIPLFRQAISDNDEYAMPHFNLGVLYEERGDVGPAVERYERAVELAPKFHKALFNLGRLVARSGDIDRTRELWEAAIESDPGFVQGHYYLAKLLMDTGGDLGRAEELTRKGIELDPEHEEGPLGYYLLADILNRTGHPAQAQRAVAKGREIQASME
jgi:arylsulfatase A-like enzyme/Tfp pilus assembly protein PilF